MKACEIVLESKLAKEKKNCSKQQTIFSFCKKPTQNLSFSWVFKSFKSESSLNLVSDNLRLFYDVLWLILKSTKYYRSEANVQFISISQSHQLVCLLVKDAVYAVNAVYRKTLQLREVTSFSMVHGREVQTSSDGTGERRCLTARRCESQRCNSNTLFTAWAQLMNSFWRH